MSNDDKHTIETITEIRTWTPSLFTFKTTRHRGYRFVAGQFARLGVDKAGEIVWRPYSICSAPWDEFLEFYSIVVPGGEFTSQLARLKVGDPILVDKRNYGFLTTDRFECGKDLWLLSTGTGLAPFLSILHDIGTWEQYEHIILVHSVRQKDELTYREVIDSFASNELYAQYAHKLRYVPVVTREHAPPALQDRVTRLLENRALERAVGMEIDVERSRVMICGNPEMVEQTRELLTGRGLTVSRRGQPGHIAVENYW